MPDGNGLAAIDHVVVLMLENRSFDHMLGSLYADSGNVAPAGQPDEGLTGSESNPDSNGQPVAVFTIEPRAGVTIPAATSPNLAAAMPSHLQEIQAELISRRFPAGQHDDADALAREHTNQAYAAYIRHHSDTAQ